MLKGHRGTVRQIQWLKDDTGLITVGKDDYQIILWRLKPDDDGNQIIWRYEQDAYQFLSC